MSRVIETEWSGRGVQSTTLYYPFVATPMIAPTKSTRACRADPNEAAEWMITAARRRPVRIAPRMSLFSQALDLVSPDLVTTLMKRSAFNPIPSTPRDRHAAWRSWPAEC